MEKRTEAADILKGIMIILVVAGHSYNGVNISIEKDVIFLFHMPLFFILSGLLLKRERLLEGTKYIKTKVQSLMIPYFVYLIIDLFLIRRDYSVNSILHAIYGGRAVSGVYWYITCYLFTLLLFSIYLKTFSDRKTKVLILAGGGIAILESHLVDKIHLLQAPGIPWNLDVSLLSLVYVGIGFFYKDKIKKLLKSEFRKYDVIAGITAVALIIFCFFIYKDGNRLYYFDMKYVYYKELILAILIPCAFGVVIMRIVHWMERAKCLKQLNNFLILCGRATIPIMFMHIPLNYWKVSLGYGRTEFIVIGVLVPLIFTVMFSRYELIRRLFGLPEFVMSHYCTRSSKPKQY